METGVNQIELNGLTFQYRESGEPFAPPTCCTSRAGKQVRNHGIKWLLY